METVKEIMKKGNIPNVKKVSNGNPMCGEDVIIITNDNIRVGLYLDDQIEMDHFVKPKDGSNRTLPRTCPTCGEDQAKFFSLTNGSWECMACDCLMYD